MLLETCEWLKATWLSTLIRESKWGFAMIEMGHLVALAFLGGALLLLGLRVFGVILTGQPLGAATSDLRRTINVSFLAIVITGALLFADGPLRYYANVAFRVKLLLIVAACCSGLLGLRFADRYQFMTMAPVALRGIVTISIVFFLGAAVAGRVIGVL
jgi:uncharacterized protein DUF6644